MIHTLIREQRLPISIEAAWDFFSSPNNLCKITPEWLCFEVRSGGSETMHAGQIITYWIKPLLDIKMSWVTEITHVREPFFFVDEQRLGPYRFWHHQHHFTASGDETIVRDKVNYALPFGVLGDAVHALWVKQKLNAIFDYRREILRDRLNSLMV